MTPDSTDPASLRHDRSLQPWRVGLVLYTFVLLIATHWPGAPPETIEPQHVSPDKLMHFMAFGIFAMMLWMSGWARRWWIAGMLSIGFVLLDEWTQSIFAEYRQASGEDIAAGILGVLTAMGWMTALGESGNPHGHIRTRQWTYALETVLEDPGNIVRLVAAGCVPLVVVSIAIYLLGWTLLDASLGNLALGFGLLAGTAALWVVLHRSMAPTLESMNEIRPCFGCGTSMSAQPPDENGWMQCNACGCEVHLAQWMQLAMPRMPLRMLVSVDGVVGIACLGLCVLIGLVLGPYSMLASGQSGLAGAIFFAALGLLGAMLWAWRRQRLDGMLEWMGDHCLHCGFDLEETTDEHGLGQCPHCGSDFARFGHQPDDEEGDAQSAYTPSNA